jgi:polar amino acid transport system substrate-binding protein
MKKGSALLLTLLLAISVLVSACGGSKSPATSSSGGEGNKAPAAASGDGSLDRVKKAGKLLVAVDATYPPMEFVDQDGKTVIGFDVDLANEIAKKLGVKAEFVVMDWDGILSGLLAKRYDVIMSSMNITPERQQQANFVEYVKMSQVFVSKKGVDVKTEKDLAGKTVVVQAETTSHEWVEKVKKESVKDIKEIRSFKGATDAFLEVKNGRGDVIVIDEPVGLYYAKQDPSTFTVTGRAMDPEPVGIAIRKEDVELQQAIDKAVKDLQADGTFKKVSEKWFGKELGK